MKEKSELRLIKEFILLRLKEPSGSVGFWLYFGFMVLFIGSVGSLLSSYPAYKNGEDLSLPLSLSIIGYAVVLLCSSSIDLIFLKLKGKERTRFHRVEGSIKMAGVILVGYSTLAVATPLIFNSVVYNIVLAICSVIIGIVLWWITNSKYHFKLFGGEEHLTEEDTTGGSTDKRLKGKLKLKGYTT